jgi:hypothetical protein
MNVSRGLLTAHPHFWKLSSTTKRRQGILTEEESQAKQKQILDL